VAGTAIAAVIIAIAAPTVVIAAIPTVVTAIEPTSGMRLVHRTREEATEGSVRAIEVLTLIEEVLLNVTMEVIVLAGVVGLRKALGRRDSRERENGTGHHQSCEKRARCVSHGRMGKGSKGTDEETWSSHAPCGSEPMVKRQSSPLNKKLRFFVVRDRKKTK
jgi:hypothetical protein